MPFITSRVNLSADCRLVCGLTFFKYSHLSDHIFKANDGFLLVTLEAYISCLISLAITITGKLPVTRKTMLSKTFPDSRKGNKCLHKTVLVMPTVKKVTVRTNTRITRKMFEEVIHSLLVSGFFSFIMASIVIVKTNAKTPIADRKTQHNPKSYF